MTELRIGELGSAGDGVAELDGRRVFVSYAAPGDLVEVMFPRPRRGKPADRGRLLRVVEPGPDRVEPACPHFGSCGGCATQHLSPAFLSGWKADRVATELRRRGFDGFPVDPAYQGGAGRRRRATLSARRTGAGIILGFRRRRSDRIVDIGCCPLLEPALEALLEPLRALLIELLPRRADLRVAMNLTDTGVDMLIDGPIPETLEAHEALAAFAETRDLARISVSSGDAPATVAERRAPELRWEGLRVAPPPGAFLQADRWAESVMRGLVTQWAAGSSAVADLYCGVGTLTGAIPRQARRLAADGDPDAVNALRRALDRGEGGATVTEVRNLERRPLMGEELAGFDCVVLDPPASGARAQCGQIAASGVGRAVYVSCDAGTFARDARILADGGLRPVEVRALDQFYWSPDVEIAALFSRD